MSEVKSIGLDNYPSKIRVGRLDTVAACILKMRRLYRAARRDELNTQKATRLCSILQNIVGCLRVADMEQRLQKLEASYDQARQQL